MKANKISIEIDCSIEEVFEFTTNPKNTSLWVDNIVKEEINEFPIKIGTIYTNVDKKGQTNYYEVVKLEQNRLFELKQKNSSYSVKYNYDIITESRTKLTYFEWVEKGELDNPFPQSILEKLKQTIKQIEIWRFLYKELAKLNTVIKSYDKIFMNIEIRDNRYNGFFALMLDVFTRYTCLTLAMFFDKRKDSWSLYRFNSIQRVDIQTIERKASYFLNLRKRKIVHLSKQDNHKSNFTYLTLNGVNEVRAIIQDIGKILDGVKPGESYFLDWPDIRYDFDCLISDLKNSPIP